MNRMIPNTLPSTQKATMCILLPHPDPQYKGFPTPYGSGFFVNDKGYLITARHVIEKADKTLYTPNEIQITKPGKIPPLLAHVSQIVKDWPSFDLALLKIDMQPTDFLQTEFNTIAEGTEVYSFGYPLSQINVQSNQTIMVGLHFHSPRATSAIISSHDWYIGPVTVGGGFPTHYVIDKPLNPGNSGGPIVVCETGKAISVCIRFQPLPIPQQGITIQIPSLYGITVSLKNIQNDLTSLGII
jgi:serine protease Do